MRAAALVLLLVLVGCSGPSPEQRRTDAQREADAARCRAYGFDGYSLNTCIGAAAFQRQWDDEDDMQCRKKGYVRGQVPEAAYQSCRDWMALARGAAYAPMTNSQPKTATCYQMAGTLRCTEQ